MHIAGNKQMNENIHLMPNKIHSNNQHSSSEIYKTIYIYIYIHILVGAISAYLEKDNNRVLKLHMNDSSYFKISASYLYTLHFNRHHTLKLQN